MDNYNLLFDEEIKLKNIGTLYIPTAREVLSLDMEEYQKMILPFRLTLDCFTINEKYKDEELKIFDILVSGIVEEYQIDLINVLRLYFKKDIILDDRNYCLIIGDSGVVYRDNFDYLSDIILKINFEQKVELEKTPIFENEIQKDIYNKITEGRRRKAQKYNLSYSDIANIVIHGGKSYIPYDEVGKMTIYQLLNSYKTILQIDNFTLNYKQYLAGADPKKLDLEHWQWKIKVK